MAKNLAFALLCAVSCAAAANMAIENASIHNTEDGANLPQGYRFRSGDAVFFSFRIAGYTKKDEEDDTRVRLSWRVMVEDAKGVPLVEGSSGKVDALASSEDKNWTPVGRSEFSIASFVPAGEYRILLEVKDEISGAKASSETPFRVAGRTVDPSATLTVRNLRLLRGEEDADAFEVAAYRPGDTLWAGFKITGYTLGDGNRFSVDYGIRVLRADGSVAYQQTDAAKESATPFYPQRYVPGVFSLNIPKDLKTGKYALEVDVKDAVCNGTCAVSAGFSVE